MRRTGGFLIILILLLQSAPLCIREGSYYSACTIFTNAQAQLKKVAIIDYWCEYIFDSQGRVIWGFNMLEKNLPAEWFKNALEIHGIDTNII
jgi:hypothetical protein